MTNLIPPKGHKTLTYEYILRVISVYGFTLGAVFVAAAVLLLPTYVLINTQLVSLEKKTPIKQELASEFQLAEKEMSDANLVIEELRLSTSSPMVASAIIEEITSRAPAQVVFQSFELDAPLGGVEGIHIQGMAASRSALSALKANLEGSPLFETAVVPIANLARETDLPFSITVTLEKVSQQ